MTIAISAQPRASPDRDALLSRSVITSPFGAGTAMPAQYPFIVNRPSLHAERISDGELVVDALAVIKVLGIQHSTTGQKCRGNNHRIVDREPVSLAHGEPAVVGCSFCAPATNIPTRCSARSSDLLSIPACVLVRSIRRAARRRLEGAGERPEEARPPGAGRHLCAAARAAPATCASSARAHARRHVHRLRSAATTSVFAPDADQPDAAAPHTANPGALPNTDRNQITITTTRPTDTYRGAKADRHAQRLRFPDWVPAELHAPAQGLVAEIERSRPCH